MSRATPPSAEPAFPGPVYVRWVIEDEAGRELYHSARKLVTEGNSFTITPSAVKLEDQ